MSEDDRNIFAWIYHCYAKWRAIQITELAQWQQLTAELHGFVCQHKDSRLALRLAIGIMDTFDDLYHDGNKPPRPDYFGRTDI